VAESVKHQHALEELVNKTKLNQVQPPIDVHLAKILITELLWGKGYLKPDQARPIKLILSYASDLKKYLNEKTSIDESCPLQGVYLISLFIFAVLIN